MGERHDAERSVREARERLTEVALELSRRASGDYVKGRARDLAREKTARAKQVARERSTEMKDRLLENPWALGFIGGVAGTVAGRLIGAKARDARIGRGASRQGGLELPYDEYTATHRVAAPASYTGSPEQFGGYSETQPGYDPRIAGSWEGGYQGEHVERGAEGEGGGLKERAGEAQARIREGAGHLRENLRGKAEDLRGRAGHALHAARDHIPDRGELREGARSVRRSADEHPGIWALAALAAGAAIGAMMPVSDRERRALQPLKSRAREQLSGLQAQARERVSSVASEVKERIGLDEGEGAGKPNGRWNEANAGGATYHASAEGGSPGPSIPSGLEVDRISGPDDLDAATTGIGYGASGDEEDLDATRH